MRILSRFPSGYQGSLCGPLYVRARTISILQANPIQEITTRQINHLESNLRPCIKSILSSHVVTVPLPSSTNCSPIPV